MEIEHEKCLTVQQKIGLPKKINLFCNKILARIVSFKNGHMSLIISHCP